MSLYDKHCARAKKKLYGVPSASAMEMSRPRCNSEEGGGGGKARLGAPGWVA